MDATPSGELTTRGHQTRERIITAACELFESKGYHATTMRDIAEAADCSLGLTYRYFNHKEDLVRVLYGRLIGQTVAYIHTLPMDTMADRFRQTLDYSLTNFQPYRPALGAFFGAAMQPEGDIHLRNDEMDAIRQDTVGAFRILVNESRDRPGKDDVADSVAMLMYSVHFLVIFFWLLDRTPAHGATTYFVEFLQEALKLMRPMLLLPVMSKAVIKLSRIMMLVFGGANLIDAPDEKRQAEPVPPK